MKMGLGMWIFRMLRGCFQIQWRDGKRGCGKMPSKLRNAQASEETAESLGIEWIMEFRRQLELAGRVIGRILGTRK